MNQKNIERFSCFSSSIMTAANTSIGQSIYIIKVINRGYIGERVFFSCPQMSYMDETSEGVNLCVYYREDEAYFTVNRYEIDLRYYEEKGISKQDLARLGVITTPLIEGKKESGEDVKRQWKAVGEYCPELQIDMLETNFTYISGHWPTSLAKAKSAEILKLLYFSADKLSGYKEYLSGKSKLEDSTALKTAKKYPWLYDERYKLKNIDKISRLELNKDLYGEIVEDKHAFRNFGFAEKEEDVTVETFESVDRLPHKDKLILLRTLAKQLGKEITDGENRAFVEEDEKTFNPNEWVSDEFPRNKVRNIDSLIKHVREQFFCADPITYKQVWRSIRVSKNSETDKAYAKGMYTNESNVQVCQMCKKPTAFVDVVQVANYGIEMPQLNLCLCKECSARYKMIRDTNKDSFGKQMRATILSLDVERDEDEYEIEFTPDTSLYFTQTHVAEIQEIFRLLDEYGAPVSELDSDHENTASGPLMHPVRKREILEEPDGKDGGRTIKAGDFVTYKRLNDVEMYDNTVQPDRFPLHKLFVGKKVGDIVTFQGKQYEITVIL